MITISITMLATTLFFSAAVALPDESITLRTFSLVTSKGENVLHSDFDRRRLTDNFGRLALKFNAFEKQYEFEFERSHPIFAPGATIKMTGHVRKHNTYTCDDSQNPYNKGLSKLMVCQPVCSLTGRRICGSTPNRNFIVL